MKNLTIKTISYHIHEIYSDSVYLGSVNLIETGLSWGGYEWVAYDQNGFNLGFATDKEQCIEYFL